MMTKSKLRKRTKLSVVVTVIVTWLVWNNFVSAGSNSSSSSSSSTLSGPTNEQLRPTVIALAAGYPHSVYRRFVGSLVATGSDANIILGVAADKLTTTTREYLESTVGVKLYDVPLVTCTHKPPGDKEIEYKCAAAYPDFKISWARFALIRDWLRDCKTCTGPVLISDARDVFFQRDPFGGEPIQGLRVYEEAPLQRTTHWLVDWPVSACKNLKLDEPMLCSGTTIGTRDAMMLYLDRMIREMEEWAQNPKCRFNTVGDDQSIHNYLFYTGQFPYAKAIPHRTGIVHTVGVEGSILYKGHVALVENQPGPKVDPSSQKYAGANDRKWIRSELIDEDGRFTNLDGTRSRVVHQFDRFGAPFQRWLDANILKDVDMRKKIKR